MSIVRRVKKAIFGYDIFISYSRRDSLDYAYAIASSLMKHGYECYIDQLSSISPGKELPTNIRKALGQATAFILVGSEGAQVSEPIENEIKLFLQENRNKPIIPVTIGGAINSDARWFYAVEGLALIDDTLDNLRSGAPAQDVIDRIINAMHFTRKSTRLRYLSVTIACLSLVLIGFAWFASTKAAMALKSQGIAERKKLMADSLSKAAEARAVKADAKASAALTRQQAADKARDTALTEKIKAENLSRLAKAEALKSGRLSHSNFLAMNASRASGYDPTLSYNLAKVAYYTAPDNVDSYSAIYSSIRGAPFYKARFYLKGVEDFDYSPDGRTIAIIGGEDGHTFLIFYDRASGRQKTVKLSNKGLFNRLKVDYSADGSLLNASIPEAVLLNADGSLAPTGSGKHLADSKKAGDQPNKKLHGNLALSSKNNLILLTDKVASSDYRTRDKYSPTVLKGHYGNKINQLKFSPDGEEIASLGDDNYFILWNNKLPAENKISDFTDMKADINSPALIAYDFKKVIVKDIATGRQSEFSGLGDVDDAGFLTNGVPYIIKNNIILILDKGSWKKYGFGEKITSVTNADKKPYSLILGDHSAGILWKDRNSINIIKSGSQIDRTEISPDGNHIAITFGRDSVAVYNLNGTMVLPVLKAVTSVAFTPESDHIVITKNSGGGLAHDGKGGTVITIDNKSVVSLFTLTGKKIWTYRDTVPQQITFNGDWQHAMTTNMLGKMVYWDIPNDRPLFKNNQGMLSFSSMFTKDKRYFLTFGVLDVEEGVTETLGAMFSLGLSGKADLAQIPQLWDIKTNRSFQFKGKDIRIADAKISPNEKFIITYDFDRNITIWDIETQKPLELTGHYKKIMKVDISRDGKWILTFSEDGTVRLWDFHGNEIYNFDDLEKAPDEVGFADNSNYIYIKNKATHGLRWHSGETKEEEAKGDQNGQVIIKTINPELLIRQVDVQKQLGTVWQMDNDLKVKYKLK